jgi:hypothetical protein
VFAAQAEGPLLQGLVFGDEGHLFRIPLSHHLPPADVSVQRDPLPASAG